MADDFRSGFVTIIGRPNVGKSTITNTLVGEKIAIVSDKPQTTRNRIMGIVNEPNAQIVLLDTPGLMRPRQKLDEFMQSSAQYALTGCDVILVVVAAGFIGAGDMTIINDVATRKEPKILAVNKIDSVARETLVRDLDRLKDANYDVILPISAKRGDNIQNMKDIIVSKLPHGPKYFPDDMITDQPERVMIADIIREKALLNLREEIPHGVGVEIEEMREAGELTVINAAVYVERETHKPIIIGREGSMLKRLGEAARADIEKLLGAHVLLKLWVRVREDWRNKPSELKTLGYVNDKSLR